MSSSSSERCIVLSGGLKEHGISRRRSASEIKWFIKNRRGFKITWDPFMTLMTLTLLCVDLIQMKTLTTTPKSTDINSVSWCGRICINSTLSNKIESGPYAEISYNNNSDDKYILYKYNGTGTSLHFWKLKKSKEMWKVYKTKDISNIFQPYMKLKNCSEKCPQTCTTIEYYNDTGDKFEINLELECTALQTATIPIVAIVTPIICLILLCIVGGFLYYFKRDAIRECLNGESTNENPLDVKEMEPLQENEQEIEVTAGPPLQQQGVTDHPPSIIARANEIVADLGLTLPNDFKIDVKVKEEYIKLPCNHTKKEAVCENPPPPGFAYKYKWNDENHDNLSRDCNEQTRQKLETISNPALNDPQLPQLLHLKDLNEGCHRFQVTVTCSAKNVLVTSSKKEIFIGVVNVDSATSVTRGNRQTKCYGTKAAEGVTAWTNASHFIEQLPDFLKSSVSYPVPLPLKQNVDIKPTKECDIYITHEKNQKQHFEHSLKVHRFTELEQSRQVFEINKGSNTIQPAIWHRRVIKSDLPVSIHWDGPEKVNDAEIAIFVKEDFVDFVERPNEKVSLDDSAKFVAKYHSESQDFKFRWKTKYTDTEESEDGCWEVHDKNKSSEFELPNLKKGYYEINVMVNDYERDCDSEATSKLRVCETSVTFNKAILSKVTAEVGINLWEDNGSCTIKEPFVPELEGSQLFRIPFVKELECRNDAVRGKEISIDIGNQSDIYIGVDMQKNGCCGWNTVNKEHGKSNSNELQGKEFDKVKRLINSQPARLNSLWHKRAQMGDNISLTQLEPPIAIFIKEVDRDPEPKENEHDHLLNKNTTTHPSC